MYFVLYVGGILVVALFCFGDSIFMCAMQHGRVVCRSHVIFIPCGSICLQITTYSSYQLAEKTVNLSKDHKHIGMLFSVYGFFYRGEKLFER